MQSERHVPRSRLAVVAVLIGLAWYAIVLCLGDVLPEDWQFPTLSASEHLWFATCFVLAVLIPAWLGRRVLASLTFGSTFPMSVLALLPAALCFVTVLFAPDFLFCGGGEEVQAEPTLLGKLAMSTFLIGLWSVAMVAEAVQLGYVFLPLASLSILALRWASGAREDEVFVIKRRPGSMKSHISSARAPRPD
jgi:hypothetical protein